MPHEPRTGVETLMGRTPSELDRLGGAVTAREIAGQPGLWRDLADLLQRRSPEIARFLDEPLSRGGLRVVFTGAGSSAWAGALVAAEARACRGHDAHAIATTDLVEGWSRHLDPARPVLLVSFGRSGDSPESMAAIDIVDHRCAEVWHLVLTCNADGALARAADGPRRFSLVMPDGSCDQGFAMTASFTTMVLAALAIFTCDRAAEAAPLIRRLADDADRLIAAWPRAAGVAEGGHDRVVYLGSGALTAAANECALKLLELTDGEVIAVGYSPLAFRHGPKTFVGGRSTLVVGFIAADPQVRPYGIDMAREIAADGRADLFVLTPAPDAALPDLDGLSVTDGPPGVGDGWLAVLYVVFGQMHAFMASQRRGLPTDRPSRSGEVSRVVRNVVIHA